MESRRDFSQRVSAGGGAGQMGSLDLQHPLFLLKVMRPHFFIDGGLQQTVGRDGSVPHEPF